MKNPQKVKQHMKTAIVESTGNVDNENHVPNTIAAVLLLSTTTSI